MYDVCVCSEIGVAESGILFNKNKVSAIIRRGLRIDFNRRGIWG